MSNTQKNPSTGNNFCQFAFNFFGRYYSRNLYLYIHIYSCIYIYIYIYICNKYIYIYILAELIHEMQQVTMAKENLKKRFDQMLKLS